MGVASWEGRIFRVVWGWLKKLIDAIREAVLRPFRDYGSAPNPGGTFMSTGLWMTAVDDITDNLVPVFVEAAETVAPDLVNLVSSTESFARTQLAETKNLLVRIPDEIYHLIFAELTDGINDGEGPKELAARIDNLLAATGQERWPNRARTIAITETNRAYNAGAYAAAVLMQQDSRTVLYKEWLASRDERVRPSHEQADGQRVPVSQAFIVGTSALMFPGDPNGPAHEVINCRCALAVRDEA
jgi:SPP1 gp7 family putative phage head morphogenesis protein